MRRRSPAANQRPIISLRRETARRVRRGDARLRLHNAAVRNEERQALSKARAFCEGLAQRRPNDPALLRVLAEVCAGLAALDARRGDGADHRGSPVRRDSTRVLWQVLVAAAPDAGLLQQASRCAFDAGFCLRVSAKMAKPCDSLRQAPSPCGTSSSVTATSPCRSFWPHAQPVLSWLSSTPGSAGSVLEERQIYEENCTRLERVLGQRGGPPTLRLELLANLWDLGRMYDQAGNRVDSANCWRRGYDLGRRLIDEMPDNGRAVYYLACCGRDLAARDRAAAPPEETARLCEQAARLLEFQRLRDRADLDNTEALTHVCWLLSDSYIQAGQFEDALSAARRATVVLAELAGRSLARPGLGDCDSCRAWPGSPCTKRNAGTRLERASRPGRRQTAWRRFVNHIRAIRNPLRDRLSSAREMAPALRHASAGPGDARGPMLPADVRAPGPRAPQRGCLPRPPEHGSDPGWAKQTGVIGNMRKPRRLCARLCR